MKTFLLAVLLLVCGTAFGQTPVAAVELTVDLVGLTLQKAPVAATVKSCMEERIQALGDVELVSVAARADKFDESARILLHLEGYAIRSGYLGVYRVMHSGGLFRGAQFEWVPLYSSFILAPADNPTFMCEAIVAKLEAEVLSKLRPTS